MARRSLHVPAMLSVVVLGCSPHHSTARDAPPTGDAHRDGTTVVDALRDARACPVDGPPVDAKFGCVQPCGDITGSTGLCHGQEVCVDPCGGCPPGCEPLV